MCTETNIQYLPEPEDMPSVTAVDMSRWLFLLRDEHTTIDIGAVFFQPVPGNWKTNPRTSQNRYKTHYLFYCPDAALTVTLMRDRFQIPAGTLAWFPPAVPYFLELSAGRNKHQLFRFRFQVFHENETVSPWVSPAMIRGADWFPSIANEVYHELTVPRPHSEYMYCSSLLKLSSQAFRGVGNDESRKPVLTQWQVQRLIDFLSENVINRPSPADLAEVVHLSPAYFARVFRRTLGISPRKWILKQRLRHGAHLLLESIMNVSEIAYRLGYDEPRLFTRQFTAEYNISPIKYRANLKQLMKEYYVYRRELNGSIPVSSC